MSKKINFLSKLTLGFVGCATAAMFAQASPVSAAPKAPAPDSGVTMVNGAGKEIKLPKAAASTLKSASAKGNTLGTLPAQTKTGDGLSTSSVLGVDERVQEGNPAAYPWGSIVYLDMGSKGQCSGFMLSRDVVVTAGHCVYKGGWATYYRAVPGKNGASEPYGSCSGGIADVWTTSNYRTTGAAEYDYGLIKLRCDIGNSTGWMAWHYNNAENHVGVFAFVEGYPGDKPVGTMWWDGDKITAQTASRFSYSIDTAPGQSGSPLYRWTSVGWSIFGIHTSGGAINGGVRFNADVMNFINYWIGQP